jgi:hypothetical protein
MSVLRSLLRRGADSRGAAEIGVVAVIGALMAGGLAGIGLTDTVVSLSDGLSWFGDDDNGELVQINPATGDPQVRLQVADPGQELIVTQGDGVLVVTNPATGEVTVINTATLAVGGTRVGSADGVEVLYDQSRLYVVDLLAGVVQQIDPTTAADIGGPWAAGTQLFDSAIDGQGRIRALRADGRLFTLGWSQAAGRVQEVGSARAVRGAGPGSVLVPHGRGVTVFASEARTAVRVDTGRDGSLPAIGLSPPLLPAPTAPVQLVPVSMEDSGTVLVIYGDRLVATDTAALGCRRPGQPVVFRGLVHVACLGAGKVIVLTRDGRDRPADIMVGGRGDPKLVLDDGRLIVYAAGAGVVVEPDGGTRPINTDRGGVPVRDPNNPPPPPPPAPPPPPPSNDNQRPDNDDDRPAPPPNAGIPIGPPPAGPPASGGPGAPVGPGTPAPGVPIAPPPTSTAPAPAGPPAPPQPPSGVTAQAGPDGAVQVGWQAATDPDQFRILNVDTGTVLATVAGTARAATVTTLAPGQSATLLVEADYAGTTVRSAPTDVVTAFTIPGAPSGVSVSATVIPAGPLHLQITVTWNPGNANGSPITGHTVRLTTDRGHDITSQPGGNQSSTMFATPCDELPVADPPCGGITINAEVRTINAAGTGPAATGSRTYDPPSTPPQITQLRCIYAGFSPEFGRGADCSVTYTGVVTTIGWNTSLWDGQSSDNVSSGMFPCGPSTTIVVTVANAAGSVQAQRTVRCQGQIP